MNNLEEKYRAVNNAYNEFSYAVIAYNTNASNKKMLKKSIKELAKEIELFWRDLNTRRY